MSKIFKKVVILSAIVAYSISITFSIYDVYQYWRKLAAATFTFARALSRRERRDLFERLQVASAKSKYKVSFKLSKCHDT